MSEPVYLEAAGQEIKISNPDKPFFPGITKLDLANYYVSVGEAAVRACHDRPTTMYRFPDGYAGEAFWQKRLPQSRPEWIRSATVKFPSGRSATMLVIHDLAHLLWGINLGCLGMNPWPVRDSDLDHPDELRIDLDPTPGIPWQDVKDVALLTRDTLSDYGLIGWPKTSGKRGIHIYVRIEPEHDFTGVRRAALALAREVERRSEGVATTAWWKEERTGVFLDYNQNARDRTIACAYGVRATEDARVSAPITWDEVPDVDPEAFTVRTVPARVATMGDVAAGIDDVSYRLEALHELAREDEAGGLSDAPWPPNFPKADNEPPRVQPSRRKKPKA